MASLPGGSGKVLLLGEHKHVLDPSHVVDVRDLLLRVRWASSIHAWPDLSSRRE